jgi:REP element-mobilizing transposase RayT
VHVTLRVVSGVGRLRTKDLYLAIRAATKTVAVRERFRIVHMTVQHDHLHLLVEAGDARALACGLRAFEISAARRINRLERRRGRVFADRYHARILTTPTAVRIALNYVLNNWRKHGEDRVRPACDWPVDLYSSGLRFTGWRERITWTVPSAYQPLVTLAPATWLLRDGWRRAGDLRIRDIPGRA